MIDLDSVLHRSARVLAQQALGTLVLLHLDRGEYYALNEVGSRIWELCDGTRRVADMVAVLSEEYDAPVETIATDIVELVRDLAHEHLVVEGSDISEGAAAPAAPA